MSVDPVEARGPDLRAASASGRWVVLATVLGSSIASLDATVVNIALPRIGQDLGADLPTLQWTVNAYTLTLAAFLLLGGSLGDRYGRRRMFVVGVAWFMGASLVCALAPTAGLLVAARALQGCGGALLVPESLAILEASFRKEDRSAAIGAWSGLGGVAIAIGPFVGGYLISAVSWRLVFFINVPLAAAVILITQRFVPETRDPKAARTLDIAGALTGALGLGGITYALIEMPERGARAPVVLFAGVLGAAALIAFFVLEPQRATPMLDLALFRARQF